MADINPASSRSALTGCISVAAMGGALRSGATTAEALTCEALARIEAVEFLVHAFVHVDREGAVVQARAADTALAERHDLGPMHGVPYALKDIFDVAGLPTTCHSKLRRGHVAEKDLEVAARFRAGGAVLLGKLGTYEFAFGGPSFDLPFPLTRNPLESRPRHRGIVLGSAASRSGGLCARGARLLHGAVPSGCRPRGAARWASSRPMAASRGAACFPSPGRWTIVAPWPALSRTPPSA